MKNQNKKATQIILLNGKSVKNIKNYNIHSNNTIYAINRKSDIEGLINKNIDVWIVTSTLDFIELYDEILEFLERNEENRLITTSEAILEVLHLIESTPLANPDKIILIDSISLKVEKVTSEEMCVSNTLSRLLAFLMLNEVEDIALFGCDGLKSENDEDIYFNQSSLSQERLSRNAIYRDMVMFDKYYPSLLRQFKRCNIKITNYNKNTFYKSFPVSVSCKIKKGANKFIIPKSGYCNISLLDKALNYKNSLLISHLYKKSKTNFFKKIKNKIKSVFPL